MSPSRSADYAAEMILFTVSNLFISVALPASIQFFPVTQMGLFFLSQLTLDALVGSRIVRFLGGLCESFYIDLFV
ncbi:hypothetical protein BDV33DRAFT_153193 [Aspergillus novoparasiticus]|uniref:Uncharacterized protein n=1 Tax=Aspergillus novoparasiticus TaxID=986946 RepID=A0A5N6EI92_9EURO|nr:hypothetical protein BDV33DRAFT_153193 [Aspergillus novoparasiticus]